MARLYTSGGEWNDATAERVTLGGSVTFSTVNPRTGTYAYRTASTLNFATVASFTGVLGRTYYGRVYAYLAGLPTAGVTATPISIGDSGFATNAANLRILSDGSLDIRIAGVTYATAPAGTVTAGVWNLYELSLNVGVGSVDVAEGRFNGVSFGTTGAISIMDAVVGGFRFGSGADGGNADFDDVALNDDQGASQNSWPGSGKVVLLKPISLNTNGGSWTDDAAATTSAALTAALDNTPPKGIADTTAGGGDHQVRNAAANTSLDMNLTTYATAGIAATDTINVVEPQINVGAPVVTGAKTGSFGITTNPTIANRVFTGGTTAAANFWRGAAPSTYPTNWTTGWERGTITYGSSVTVGSSPVARVTITGGTTTRIAMVDAMGIYVDYTPATTKAPPFQPRTARNSLLRR